MRRVAGPGPRSAANHEDGLDLQTCWPVVWRVVVVAASSVLALAAIVAPIGLFFRAVAVAHNPANGHGLDGELLLLSRHRYRWPR